ncbi:TetR/AcrR family transcriptional regulator [Demequina salsinemoris]|uniref:TetR/AcrR family transcriptional regulator n=1 Tax=Demequina salsinemoris TaxID=577470 RepID=UPI000781B2E8|nr:TetR/AcrR family transcriptional regulator [Demequina salsinemoris]
MATPRANPGPRAAAANRRALIDAARVLFDERGIDVPLVEIARRAGVGQGVLYRHFPDRASLAFAVFDENMTQLETLAAQHSPMSLRRLGHEVSHRVQGIAPLMSFATSSPDDPRLTSLEARMRVLLTAAREHAQATGRLREDVTVDDLVMTLSMVTALTCSVPPEQRETSAEHAWEILERGLSGR